MIPSTVEKTERRSPEIIEQELRLLSQKVQVLEGEVIRLTKALEASQEEKKILVQKTRIDPLTGALNRLALEEELQKIAVGVKSGKVKDVALLYCDMDFFKTAQEERSHGWGDEALKLFAATLSETLRESDWVARVGGDEFAVLLVGVNSEKAKEITQRIQNNLAKLSVKAEGYTGKVAATIGVSTFPETPLESLIQKADENALVIKKAREIGR